MIKRVILAEDDADDREIFKAIIADLNVTVDLNVVHNGEDLVSLMNSADNDAIPHLIVLDQNMPRLNGLDSILLLKQDHRFSNIPMIIYSTYHETNFVRNCQMHGIELLLKPDTYDKLKALIEYVFRRYLRIDV